MTFNCKCDDKTSPFHWHGQPSIFSTDKSYRPVGEMGLTLSEKQTAVVERERAAGRHTGTIAGISGKNAAEKERLRVADFHIYSRQTSPVTPRGKKAAILRD